MKKTSPKKFSIPRIDMSPQDFMYSTLSLFLVSVLILSIVATVALTGSVRRSNGASNSITVTGVGEASAAPDIATVSFAVNKVGSSIKDTQDSVSKRSNALIAQLRSAGIKSDDIKTESFSINPEYQWYEVPCTPESTSCGGQQKLIGYRVTHMISLKIRDLNKVGDIIALVSGAGVDSFSGPFMEVEDRTAVEQEARMAAVKDARAKAKQMADVMGVRLGRMISLGDAVPAYPPMYAMANASAGAMDTATKSISPEIMPGQNTVTINVGVTYRIR